MIRRIRPITKVIHEFMLLRVLMDVDDQAHEIRSICDQNSLEGTFKQSATSSDGVIDAARVGVEEIREILTWFLEFDVFQIFFVFNKN